MDKGFITIVITSPEEVKDEHIKIMRLLNAGVDYVHIRKPNHSLSDIKRLIENIDYPLRKRLKLHGHFELLNEMNLGGVHLNSRNHEPPENASNISKSCHSLNELKDARNYEYVTLSPIFDSISKMGYKSKFDIDKLSNFIARKRVIALGGISPDTFLLLKSKGFYGAALLGYIWNDDFQLRLSELKDIIVKIQKQDA